MNHDALREQLVDLAAGTLSPRQAAELEAHLTGCPACREELGALRATRRLLADLPPLQAPEAGTGVLLAAARQAAEQWQQRPSRLFPRWLWAGALGLAGAAAAVTLSLRLGQTPPASPFQEDREALAGRVAATEASPASAPSPVEAPAPVAPQAPAPPAPAVARMEKAKKVAEAKDVAEAKAVAEPRLAEAREVGEAKQEAAVGPARRVDAAQARIEAVQDQASRAGANARARADAADLAGAGSRAEERTKADQRAGLAGRVVGEDESAVQARSEAPRFAAAPPSPRPQAAAKAAPPAAPSTAFAGGAAREAAGAPTGLAGETVRTFERCPGERVRRLVRDGAGRLVRRVREGTLDRQVLVVEEHFQPGGALASAAVRIGDRLVVVGASEAAAGRLEPVPGLRLARDAAEAEAAPPRCGP